MKEPNEEGVAIRLGPESCAGHREVSGEALTGGSAGAVLSCDIKESGVPTPLLYAEGNIDGGAQREPSSDPAQSETRCMRGRSWPELGRSRRRPAPRGSPGRSGKAEAVTLDAHVVGKSDDCVVPMKPANEAVRAVEESVEGRRSAKGNDMWTAARRTQSRNRASIRTACVRGAGGHRPLRHYPRQEPCVVPHARICAGGQAPGNRRPYRDLRDG